MGSPGFYLVFLGFALLQWVLLGFQWFYWILPSFFFSNSTSLNWILPGFIDVTFFCLVFHGFSMGFHSCTGFYLVFLVFPFFCQVFHQVSPSWLDFGLVFPGFPWIILHFFTEFDLHLPSCGFGSTGLYWVLPSFFFGEIWSKPDWRLGSRKEWWWRARRRWWLRPWWWWWWSSSSSWWSWW